MDYSIETLALDKLETDCIIVGLYDNQQLSPSAEIIDANHQELISKIIARGDISGENSKTLLINYLPDSTIRRVLLVGLGENPN